MRRRRKHRGLSDEGLKERVGWYHVENQPGDPLGARAWLPLLLDREEAVEKQLAPHPNELLLGQHREDPEADQVERELAPLGT